jgi:hypothetical protein
VKGPFRSATDAVGFGLFGLAVLVGLALLAQRALLASDGRFVVQDASAPWIMAPLPFSSKIRQWGRERAVRTLFVLRFEPTSDAPAVLGVRTFGPGRVLLNGEELPLRTGGARWKWLQQLDVSRWLVPGENELRVEVRNLRGPGLVSARLVSGDRVFVSDPSWQATVAGRQLRPALIARDVVTHPDAEKFVPPLLAARDRLPHLIGLIVVFASAAYWGRRRFGDWDPRRRDHAVLGALTLLWGAFLVRSFWPLDPIYGFDATKHLEYLDILLREGRLPLATDGWSTYHPPLFYGLAALMALPGEWLGNEALGRAIKLPAFAAGLGLAWQSLRLAQRLLPEHGMARPAAAVFAGILPMNVYMAASFSNEALLAFLCAGALVAAVDVLRSPDLELRRVAALSVWLGLALLTKFTALVLVVVTLVFVGARLGAQARTAAASTPRSVAALLGPMLLICGWYYARNVAVYGQPIMGNWQLNEPGQIWWSPPGFHTLEYYTRFGESLTRPYFSAFVSFWDALYSTTWGNPRWRYGWMSTGYLLALPVCGLVLIGFGALKWQALRSVESGERLALAFLVTFAAAMLFAVLYATLALPYSGQAKAFYALSVTPVVAVAFGHGVCWLEARLASIGSAAIHSLAFAVLATAFSVFAISYL